MKLYTEEQVKEMLSMTDMLMHGDLIPHDDIVASFTPIELPSDEEIEGGMKERLFLSDKHLQFNAGEKAGFKLGARWMKEQILNK